jgi:hypothetical protein
MAKDEKDERTKAPADRAAGKAPAPASSRRDIEAFLDKVKAVPAAPAGRGRLIFALDATMSRQPTWDAACRLQGEMFSEAGRVGGLDVQLVYYRGFGECRASRWVSDTRALRDLMTAIDCRGGLTQIGKVLAHARRETQKRRVQAMVFVGDALEEPIDALAARAGELGILGLPVFVFQEGHDPEVEKGYREIARLSGGAYARFNQNAAAELAELLRAVAVFAAGGRKALAARKGASAQLLLGQIR